MEKININKKVLLECVDLSDVSVYIAGVTIK